MNLNLLAPAVESKQVDLKAGGLMVSASAFGSSGPDRALARDIVLYSWERHLTLTVPLSTQVYKWVLVNLMLGGTAVID